MPQKAKKVIHKKKIPRAKAVSKRKKVRTKAQPKTKHVKRTRGAEIKALNVLEKYCTKLPNPEINAAFGRLRGALKKIRLANGTVPPKAAPPKPSPETEGPRYFNSLELLRRVLMAEDLLFLSRQVTYHISADAELPGIWADPERVRLIFSQLLEHLVRRANRNSRISISFRTFSLRRNPAIAISFSNNDKLLGESEKQLVITDIFQDKPDTVSGVSLSNCRNAVLHQRGQLWIELPKPYHPVYNLVLPVQENASAQEEVPQQTFKYDISISNYADVRKRFGIRKSQSLVTQVEHYVRSLVRYPIDMVLSLSDRGIITTIYETQRGTAQSVASRISERLGSERFRIGKRSVEIYFSYHLSPLSSPVLAHAKTSAGGNS